MNQPILLFGMPRSGTTWLGKVFDSHPDTLYRHEPDSDGRFRHVMPMFPNIVDAADYREALIAYIRALPQDRSLRVAGKLPLFAKTYQSPVALQTRRLLIPACKALSRFVPVSRLPEFVRADAVGSVRLAWKSIESLGRLGTIARALPECRAIHIIRHPCGYVSSVLSGESAGLMPGAVSSSEDYGILQLLLQTDGAKRRDLSLEYFRTLEPAERLAWRWLLYNEKALEELREAGNARVAVYEELCADPTGGYQGLFEFAGLDWSPQSAAFVDASTHTEKSAYFSVFKDPQRAAFGWQQKLAQDQQARILRVVAGTEPGALYGL